MGALCAQRRHGAALAVAAVGGRCPEGYVGEGWGGASALPHGRGVQSCACKGGGGGGVGMHQALWAAAAAAVACVVSVQYMQRHVG